MAQQTGLKIYSTFIPRNDKEGARQFKETILSSPFDYRATSVATNTNQVDLFEISVGNASRLPAHQRIRHSYLNVLNRVPDEDGLIRESTLGINQFGAKVIAPEIFLANSYMTEDQYQYIQMVDSQVLQSPTTARETASMPLSKKLNSSNTFVRAQGSLIQDARKNFTESQNLGLLMPNSMDIDELRTYISSLF